MDKINKGMVSWLKYCCWYSVYKICLCIASLVVNKLVTVVMINRISCINKHYRITCGVPISNCIKHPWVHWYAHWTAWYNPEPLHIVKQINVALYFKGKWVCWIAHRIYFPGSVRILSAPDGQLTFQHCGNKLQGRIWCRVGFSFCLFQNKVHKVSSFYFFQRDGL